MRFLIAVPGLLFETLLYYSSPMNALQNTTMLIYVYGVVSFVFVVWWFGWLSSFFNTAMFMVNRVSNGLIFGENLFLLAGYGLSNHGQFGNMWWMGFVILLGNCAAIAVSYGIVTGF